MARKPPEDGRPRRRYVLCLHRGEHPASIESRKVYPVIPDKAAAAHGMIRIIDESGEDYLYPAEWFLPISLKPAARAALHAVM